MHDPVVFIDLECPPGPGTSLPFEFHRTQIVGWYS